MPHIITLVLTLDVLLQLSPWHPLARWLSRITAKEHQSVSGVLSYSFTSRMQETQAHNSNQVSLEGQQQ